MTKNKTKRPRGHALIDDLPNTLGDAIREAAEDAGLIAKSDPINQDFPAIPDFLLTKNEGKKIAIPKMANIKRSDAPAAMSAEDAAMAALDPETRRRVEEAIADGSFRKHWVTDYGSVRELIRVQDEKRNKRAEGLARLAGLPRPAPKPPRAAFGKDVKITKILVEFPRAAGTKAHGLYEEMKAWHKKHGAEKDVAALLSETGYREVDFKWDYARKAFQTDKVMSIPDAAPRAGRGEAKPKAARKAAPVALPPASEGVTWSGKASRARGEKVKPVAEKETLRKEGKKAVRAFKKEGKRVTKVKSKKR